jgi:GT2 family glycosyltransferase
MNINVVIPVVQPLLCSELIGSMERNTVLPQRVIIIDNTERGTYCLSSDKFQIDVYHSVKGRVNESWNLGVSLVDITCDYVSILNDDVYLNSWFFQRVLETFESQKACGVACPLSVDSIEKLGKGKGPRRIKKMGVREGFAFTIKKTYLDAIAPIPTHRIVTFHGDDWYWYWMNVRGHFWYKDLGNIIFHHVGSSVLPMGFRKVKKKERNEWKRIMDELGG